MAKRSRGAARPGQRPTRRPNRPSGRPGAAAATDAFRPATTRPPLDDSSAAEADLELAVDGRGRRDRGRAEAIVPARTRGTQSSSLLAARAAQDYHYVVTDVRRIGIVGGGLVVVLLVLYVLIAVAHVISL